MALMTEVLIKLFVRDHKNTSDFKVRERYGLLAGVVGIVTNLLLFILKIVLGVVFHSIAITADGINNLSDSGSALVTLVGFKLAGKPPDAEHPFGHARIEYISGLVVSFTIVFFGLQLIISAGSRIIKPLPTEFSWVFMAGSGLSILVKLWQVFFYRRVAYLIKSGTLEATAVDSRNDVLTSATVLVAAVISRLTGFNLDGYAGVAVAVFIVVSGIDLVIETSSPLLGTAPKGELVKNICAKLLSYEGILGIHDLHIHSYGPNRYFASVHCEVSAGEDIMVSHDLIDNIEREFKEEMGIHLVIHLDPVDIDDERTNVLREQVTALLEGISPQLYIHDFRVVWGVTHSNLIFDIEVPFNFSLDDNQLKEIVAGGVRALDSYYNAIITIDHHYVPREYFREKENNKK